MERINFFKFKPALLFLFLILFGSQVRSQGAPNIILIMADDLGYETLGCNGGQSYETPNLDQLAKEGMRFDYCYSTPLCTPSRVQIMTGKYNFRNYVGFGLLDPKEKTFGNYMQEAGLKTYIAGKWQLLGNKGQQKLAGGKTGTTPEVAGFDDYCLWQIEQIGSRYKDPILSIKGKETLKYDDKYGPDIFLEHIEKFMEKNKNEPMFIYYPMVLTHDPFVPTPDNPDFKNFNSNSKVNDPGYFGDMVQYMDKLIGRVVKKTEELGIRENTVIIFIGDNGTDHKVISMIDNSKLRGDKGNTTNAGTHVPMIVNWKGKIKEGSVNENMIDFTDFLPTLMDIVGEKIPRKKNLDGTSFYPQLFGDDSKVRDWVFCDYNPHWGNFVPRKYVQNKEWKLYDNGGFYNLQHDPLEKNPLNVNEQPKEVQVIITQFEDVLNNYK